MKIYDDIRDNSTWWENDTSYNLDALYSLLFLVPPLLYHVVLEITMNGRSVGKKIMSLQVVSENGGRPGLGQFLIRWLIRDIWFFMLLLIGINTLAAGRNSEGLFMILLSMGYFVTDTILVVTSRKGQRIGDILAHTILIRTNTRSDIEETVFQEVSANYVPSFPGIMRLSDRDINAIKSILETAKKKDDFYMASNAAEKIKNHLKIESDLSPFEFLEILLKDYNYLSTK